MSQDLPILLRSDGIECDVSAPIGAFLNYVNALFAQGLTHTDLPGAFRDLYLLDYYQARVRNGGHSQFIRNSGALLAMNLDHALSGAERLNLPALSAIILECRDWVAAHPDAALAQNGFSMRAAALEPLDARLYALTLDDAALAAFLDMQPQTVRDWVARATAATDFNARAAYYLAVGAWLLTQPQTRLLPQADWQAAVAAIGAADPQAQVRAQARRMARDYATIHKYLPTWDNLGFALALRAVWASGVAGAYQNRYIRKTSATDYSLSIGMPKGRDSMVLMRKGARFSLHDPAARPPFSARYTLTWAARRLGLVSGSAFLRAIAARPPRQAGRERGHVTLPEDPAETLKRLHVPAALALYHADNIHDAHGFPSGQPLVYAPATPHVVWTYKVGSTPLQLEVTATGVRIGPIAGDDDRFYANATLRDWTERNAAAVAPPD